MKVVEFAQKHYSFNFDIVFFDVTTFYFETFEEDDPKKQRSALKKLLQSPKQYSRFRSHCTLKKRYPVQYIPEKSRTISLSCSNFDFGCPRVEIRRLILYSNLSYTFLSDGSMIVLIILLICLISSKRTKTYRSSFSFSKVLLRLCTLL